MARANLGNEKSWICTGRVTNMPLIVSDIQQTYDRDGTLIVFQGSPRVADVTDRQADELLARDGGHYWSMGQGIQPGNKRASTTEDYLEGIHRQLAEQGKLSWLTKWHRAKLTELEPALLTMQRSQNKPIVPGGAPDPIVPPSTSAEDASRRGLREIRTEDVEGVLAHQEAAIESVSPFGNDDGQRAVGAPKPVGGLQLSDGRFLPPQNLNE